MQGDAGAGVGREDAGWGFAGEVPGDGFYGDYQGCTADKGTGYRFDASDGGLYQSVWEWNGCDGVFGWDGNWMEKLKKNRQGLQREWHSVNPVTFWLHT